MTDCWGCEWFRNDGQPVASHAEDDNVDDPHDANIVSVSLIFNEEFSIPISWSATDKSKRIYICVILYM